jgi:hypothetical protein
MPTLLNNIVTLGESVVVVLAFPIVVLILGLPIALLVWLVLALARAL